MGGSATKVVKTRKEAAPQARMPSSSPQAPSSVQSPLDLQSKAGNAAVSRVVESSAAAGPTSSNQSVELNATIGGVFIQSARADVADGLLRGYSRNIAVRLASVEAFVETQAELQNEFPVISRLVNASNSQLPKSKTATADLARADACIKRGDFRSAVDLLGAAENEVDQLVRVTNGYRESQELATEHFITGLQGAKVAGGIAVGVLTAGSGTAFVAVAGAAYAAAQEASEQAMKVHLGLMKEMDWEGIVVDAVINVAIGKLTVGLSRFTRGAQFGQLFGKVKPWQYRQISNIELREFASRTAKALLTKQTVKEMLIARLSNMLQLVLKTGYDAVRGREQGEGFVSTLRKRFAATLFDENGDVAFQQIFFTALADALGSATNRAAVAPSKPLPNEPPIGKQRIAPISKKERVTAENLLRRTAGTAQKGPAEVVAFPAKNAKSTMKVIKSDKSGAPLVTESTGIVDRGAQQPDRVTVRFVEGKANGRVVSIEVPAYHDLPVTKRDGVFARAMKLAGMGWTNWSNDSSHIQALEHRGAELPYNREPAPPAANRGVKGQVTHRSLEVAFTQFQKANAGTRLGRVLFSRELNNANQIKSERIEAFDEKGKVVFDASLETVRGKGKQVVDNLASLGPQQATP